MNALEVPNTPPVETDLAGQAPVSDHAPSNVWTMALRIVAGLNVAGVLLLGYSLYIASALFTGFSQMADVTTTPSSVPVALALGGALILTCAAVWVTLSLSPSPRVKPTRRLVATAFMIGGNSAAVLLALLAGSVSGVVVGVAIIGLTVVAWRSSYRIAARHSIIRFLLLTAAVAPLALFVTAPLTLFASTFGPSSPVAEQVQLEARTSYTRATATQVWMSANAFAAFAEDGDGEVTVADIAKGAEDVGARYDQQSGLLTVENGVPIYVCATGVQDQPCR